MFTVTLGCDRVYCYGHIDTNTGIFAWFDEKLKRIKTGHIMPAKENASCKCRTKAKCSMECKHAVYRIVSGGKVSDRKVGLTM